MSISDNQTGRLSPQSMLRQRYIIVRQAGRGGMGAVYQAVDTRSNQQQVAIKEMSQAHLSGAELTAAATRFQQEANMLHMLSHPNLPRIYDAFSEQGRSYLVMDFIDGKTLQQLLKEMQHPLSVPQTLQYAQQLCAVLSYLHQQRPPIIFRDVKPTNIMVTASGQLFLIDFGIARFFKEGQEQDTSFLGSPGYAPPEQHGLAQTNPRADIYGLGATLHYCLTGRDPYYSKEHFSFPPIQPQNPQVPLELDQLIQRMVSHNEQERPSALEVQQALSRVGQQASDHTSTFVPASNPAHAPTYYGQPTPTMQQDGVPQMPATVAVTPAMTPPSSLPYTTPMQPQRATASLWTRPFIMLFAIIFVAMAGISLYVMNVPYVSGQYQVAFMLEAVLSLLLLGIAGVSVARVQSLVAKVILLLTGCAALLSGIAALAIGLNITALSSISASIGFDIRDASLIYGLIGVSIISLFWLLRPISWLYRGILLILFAGPLVLLLNQPSSNDVSTTAHTFPLLALILLVQGVLLAVQVERSHP